ncbi:MAG: outer membrane lipoprotein-sorting protein [Nitrospinae bacterium]|nr:outer membrane lipoprotein-sorting protein [Nitrospinota bacterium]
MFILFFVKFERIYNGREDVRDQRGGQGYLSINRQWLYLPSYKKAKRIASVNKSGSFQVSEFSYEDPASFDYRKYTYNFLREEEYEGKPALVVERVPVDRYSGYSKERRRGWTRRSTRS